MSCDSPDTGLKAALQAHIKHLSETIGGRHLGSIGEQQAQEYIRHELAATGLEVVRETFATPGWRCGSHRVELANGATVDAAPCYFSPGGKVTAPLKTFWTALDADKALEKFADTVVFAGNYDFVQVADTNALADRLEAAGAAALIINSPYNDTYSTKIIRSPNLRRMPVFTVSQRTALRLAREEGQPVTLSLEAERFEHTSCNLVARQRASGTAIGKIVIGAHYDSSPAIPGALDNASGVAALLELAKSLKGDLSCYDIDWVAFGGEEYGGPGYGIGGHAYMQAHHGEPLRAMICLDGIGSYLTLTEARVGRSAALRTLVRKNFTRSQTRILPYRRGSDNSIFHDHGIATVWFTDGGAENGVRHYPLHSPQDDIGLIDFNKLTNLTCDLRAMLQALVRDGLREPEALPVAPCGPEDMDAIARLVREVWTMGGDCTREKTYGRIFGKPWQDRIEESVRNSLGSPHVSAFKVEIDGALAGFASCRVNPDNGIGEIGYNAVDPRFLGHGIGKTLLQHALEHLRQEGIRDVEVVTGLDPGHAPARSIYESAGFKPFIQSIRYRMRLGD